ncbi:hypothetical protein [Rhizobium sp. L51/94]|uniref:hypothetical protein n=1 Tax=Rhizobium sp. L51/94 TaxID=2819999 RepID=UPI00214CD99F|nr:hypothetical protein [Rhizobium sp. L51/94]
MTASHAPRAISLPLSKSSTIAASAFISVQDQIDTASPIGRAMSTIIGAMAELGAIPVQRVGQPE